MPASKRQRRSTQLFGETQQSDISAKKNGKKPASKDGKGINPRTKLPYKRGGPYKATLAGFSDPNHVPVVPKPCKPPVVAPNEAVKPLAKLQDKIKKLEFELMDAKAQCSIYQHKLECALQNSAKEVQVQWI